MSKNFVFDPKDPEKYFIAFSALQDFALDLQKKMLDDNKSSESTNQTFFDDIRKKQDNMINAQKQLHNEAKRTVNLATTTEASSTHKQFNKTIKFFQEKESKMAIMAEMMEDMTRTVSKLPS
ncbi:hypothetical protein M9Y10_028951 [Tritrichomonas musculus]|uniref:Uncharacterized protein n=1 Tax=Tritrichomonas musculus TaxID=1915356 RepID=A0ABR2KKX7_9EUKA